MLVKNEMEKVWLIEDNKLKCTNKIVSKLNYFGKEVAILKTKANWDGQEMLFKDKKENCYWELGIAPIRFSMFLRNVLDNNEKDNSCNEMLDIFNEENIIRLFKKSIDKKSYFNTCQLKFINKHCDMDMFERAKESREDFLYNKKQEDEIWKEEQQRKAEEKIKQVNNKFYEQVKGIKNRIQLREIVKSEKLKFYKDNKDENGITEQNCFLYLAKQYGINIPLATQGFINNKLVDYNFGTGQYRFLVINGNKKGSEEIHKYFKQIYQKVVEETKEYKEQKQAKN